MSDLVTATPRGLYCARGDFFIDPSEAVNRAILTHAHADHAHQGHGSSLVTPQTAAILKQRFEHPFGLEALRYGQEHHLGDVYVSLHPAGHVLGSAQVRIECDGEVWVVSGDYKREPDPTCEPFKVMRCNTFVTEATFALPVFRWDSTESVIADIFEWWQHNRAHNRASVLYSYALGKAQRILSELQKHTDQRVFVHGAIAKMTEVYREAGVAMLPTESLVDTDKKQKFEGELVLAPLSAQNTPWLKRFGDYESGFASGWMRIRGERRRRTLDRGFVLSDHADWPALLQTIRDSNCERVLVTHGYQDELARFLTENGVVADKLATTFAGEADV